MRLIGTEYAGSQRSIDQALSRPFLYLAGFDGLVQFLLQPLYALQKIHRILQSPHRILFGLWAIAAFKQFLQRRVTAVTADNASHFGIQFIAWSLVTTTQRQYQQTQGATEQFAGEVAEQLFQRLFGFAQAFFHGPAQHGLRMFRVT